LTLILLSCESDNIQEILNNETKKITPITQVIASSEETMQDIVIFLLEEVNLYSAIVANSDYQEINSVEIIKSWERYPSESLPQFSIDQNILDSSIFNLLINYPNELILQNNRRLKGRINIKLIDYNYRSIQYDVLVNNIKVIGSSQIETDFGFYQENGTFYDNFEFKFEFPDGSVINSSGLWNISYSSGVRTIYDLTDDEYTISGMTNSYDSDNNIYSVNIESNYPLRKEKSCSSLISGMKNYYKNGNVFIKINYQSESGCLPYYTLSTYNHEESKWENKEMLIGEHFRKK
jgi:hypothetical protein